MCGMNCLRLICLTKFSLYISETFLFERSCEKFLCSQTQMTLSCYQMDEWIANSHIRRREQYNIYVPTLPVPVFDLVVQLFIVP